MPIRPDAGPPVSVLCDAALLCVGAVVGAVHGSRKAHVDGPDGLRVPVRRVDLSNGEHHDVYDTSGPYTDLQVDVDVRRGLAPLRLGWIQERSDVEELPESTANVALA